MHSTSLQKKPAESESAPSSPPPPLARPEFADERALLQDSLSRLVNLSPNSPNFFASPLGPLLQARKLFMLPRFLFIGENAAEEAWRIAIYAGLDGTDTRSSLASLRVLERFAIEPRLGESYNLMFHPLVNPSGLEDGTAHTRAGHYLLREHWGQSAAAELQLLEREARATQYHGMITVRTDPDVTELHGWLRSFSPQDPFLHGEPVRGTSRAGYLPFKFPVRWEPNPEGFFAQTGPLTLADDLRMRPFELVLVLPGREPLEWAVQAVTNTLHVFLNNFRTAVGTALNI